MLTGSPIQFSTDNKDCMKRFLLILLTICLGVATEGKAQNRLYPPRVNSYKYLSLNKNIGEISNFAFVIESYTCYYDDSDSALVLEVYKGIISNSLFWKIKRLFSRKVYKATIKKYRCPISPEATRCFRELFLSAINSSSYLSDPLANDGYEYRLYAERLGSIGSIIMAEGDGPPYPKDSNCGILVDILYRISDAVKNNSPEELENLIPIAEDLTLKFKSLYPQRGTL